MPPLLPKSLAVCRGWRSYDMQQKRLTPLQAKQTIKHFCAYQERCHSEVKEKLFAGGLTENEVDEIISELISEDYLNEERFARAFARGKFRMKQWGRIKIRYELKKRSVSDYCIKKGLSEIDGDEYDKTLKKLFDEKEKLLRGEKNIFTKKKKICDYLIQKGYERELIMELFK